MIRESLFARDGLPMLRRGLEVSDLRRSASAENVANVLTPGYRAKRVAFEELLSQESASLRLRGTHENHHGPVEGIAAPQVRFADDPALPNGVNNVDIDSEMAVMGWNRVQMSALAQFASRQYRLLNDAIGRSRG